MGILLSIENLSTTIRLWKPDSARCKICLPCSEKHFQWMFKVKCITVASNSQFGVTLLIRMNSGSSSILFSPRRTYPTSSLCPPHFRFPKKKKRIPILCYLKYSSHSSSTSPVYSMQVKTVKWSWVILASKESARRHLNSQRTQKHSYIILFVIPSLTITISILITSTTEVLCAISISTPSPFAGVEQFVSIVRCS